jgi:hypothetical protein
VPSDKPLVVNNSESLNKNLSPSFYQVVPVEIIQDPYAGKTRADLLEILLWYRARFQDPLYPELFRNAWKVSR